MKRIATARWLAGLERGLLAAPWRCREPVLFVLGLPRSGTTLVSQVLVSRARVAYFTRGVGRNPRAPVLVSAAQRLRFGPYVSNFASEYGKVRIQNAPREAGGVWMRFFPRDAYVGAEDLPRDAVVRLRRMVAATQLSFGGLPFVNKNVKHMLRIPALASAFPRAHFLVVRRDPQDVALSIWRARHKQQSDPQNWWSVRPPEYAALRDRPVAEQVVGQIVGLRDRMQHDLANLAPGRVTWLDYASFCARPDSVFDGLDASGLRLRRIGRALPPFEVVRHEARDSAEADLLEKLPDVG